LYYQNKIGEMFITSMDTRAKHGLESRHPWGREYCDVSSVS